MDDERLITIEKVPVWAICYLEYGDATGLEEDEVMEIDEWIEDNCPNGFVMEIVGGTDVSPYFTRYPLFGKACDVYDVNFYRP